MSDQHIDDILKKAARSPEQTDPKLVAAIISSIKPDLKPVKALPSTWILASGLTTICVLVALGAAAHLGFSGIAGLGLFARVLIFSMLAVLVWIMATAFVDEMIPGSRRFATANTLLAVASVALLIVFAFLFRDYQTHGFVSAGIRCLVAGLACAVPAGFLGWLLLRRGFAANPITAGIIGGTFAGLAGVAMLELHCNNFQALHILVWHTAVLPAAALLGATASRLFTSKK